MLPSRRCCRSSCSLRAGMPRRWRGRWRRPRQHCQAPSRCQPRPLERDSWQATAITTSHLLYDSRLPLLAGPRPNSFPIFFSLYHRHLFLYHLLAAILGDASPLCLLLLLPSTPFCYIHPQPHTASSPLCNTNFATEVTAASKHVLSDCGCAAPARWHQASALGCHHIASSIIKHPFKASTSASGPPSAARSAHTRALQRFQHPALAGQGRRGKQQTNTQTQREGLAWQRKKLKSGLQRSWPANELAQLLQASAVVT